MKDLDTKEKEKPSTICSAISPAERKKKETTSKYITKAFANPIAWQGRNFLILNLNSSSIKLQPHRKKIPFTKLLGMKVKVELETILK